MYASTSPAIVGNNGRYVYADTQNFLIYGDVMAMFNKHFGDFSVNAALGGSINVQTENSLTLIPRQLCTNPTYSLFPIL